VLGKSSWVAQGRYRGRDIWRLLLGFVEGGEEGEGGGDPTVRLLVDSLLEEFGEVLRVS
jgi:hypothetical protein